MSTTARLTALTACAALLAGCGGSGSTPSAAHAVTPATTATSAPSGAPLATARLTLSFPKTFHTAHAATAKSRAAAAATTRKPAYVNPTGSNTIDVFVDGVDETPGAQVQNTNDGTQTFTIAIYSTTVHQIVAVENEAGLNSATLAIGETDLPANSFSSGDVTSIGLTMLMNVASIGITTDPTMGSDATTGSSTNLSTPFQDMVGGCSVPVTGNNLYLFDYDLEQGFVSNPGAGVALPSLTGSQNQPGTEPPSDKLVFPSTLSAGYVNINYTSYGGGMILNAATSNPASAISQDALYNQGVYPGVDSLFQSGTLSNAIYSITDYYGGTITTQIYVSLDLSGC